MRRKSLLFALLAVLALIGVVATSLALLVLHEPAYYKRGAIFPGKERHAQSNQFWEEFSRLYNSIQQDELDWSAQFTTEQINSYLLEDFLRSGADTKMLPDNIQEPRIAIDADRLRLGFRYGIGRWSTIITVDVRLWPGRLQWDFGDSHGRTIGCGGQGDCGDPAVQVADRHQATAAAARSAG